MQRSLFIFLIIIATMPVFAQNKILNPGFDQKNDCPKHSGQISMANFWLSPNNSTPDYFNDCSTSFDYGTEFNKKGGQVPHSGHAYAGIQVYNMNHNEYYEYLETRFDTALTASEQYCIRVWVSLGQSKYALTEFGVAFSVDEIKSASPQRLDIPFTRLSNAKPLSDSENWMCLHGVYTARGGERFITFGNFLKNNFRILQLDNSNDTLFKSAYYFIDDISVEPVKDQAGCTCN